MIRVLGVLALCLLGCVLTAQGQDPKLTNTNNPMDTNVSVGATVNFRLYASSTNLPMTYQWYHAGAILPAATNVTLLLTNLTVAHAGGYTAWITNAIGGYTNTRTAILIVLPFVQPTFTKITTGPVVTDVGIFPATPAWGDLNNDGFADLIIADDGTWTDVVVERAPPLVYLNNTNGTFRRASEADIGPLAITAVAGGMAVWADYDNDGYLDFFQQAWLETNRLWRGGADGKFSLVTSNVGPNIKFAGWGSWGYSWADYNRDGFLDLYVTTAWVDSGTVDYLYRNNGDGSFAAPLDMGGGVDSQYASWADYDNDGDPDVMVGPLYRNDGGGNFTDVRYSPEADALGSWGDYDNDGDLDMFSLTGLYENNGAGGFTKRKGGGLDTTWGWGAWVDIDNDGYLELYVGDFGQWRRRLFRFDPATKGFIEFSLSPITSIPMANANIAWADYDNNGFMDLVLASGERNVPNRLYRNNGNGNHWLHVKPIGTRSNRSAIGARVIATAVVFSQELRQMRELNGNVSASNLRAHFGLGDATNVSHLRIEWPSGAVQEIPNVAANQVLTVYEPPAISAAVRADGACELTIKAEPNRGWQIQASSDLLAWQQLTTVTNTSYQFQFTDPRATNYTSRFYRLQVP